MFEEQTFLREIAEAAVDTAYAKDLDGRYVWASQAGVGRMGLEPAKAGSCGSSVWRGT
ncbi:MAG: hypothetical protein H0V29_10920 [Thermoleophilaceae bacterium]|nr:hypothetical protein [Thermoleophilaceae bacterium]